MNHPQCIIWSLQVNKLQIKACKDFLSPDEIERCDRFLHADKSLEFSATRASLRLALASLSQLDPSDFTFSTNNDGKPFCQSHPQFIYNVSHSHERALIAVVSNAEDDFEIGIDIEKHRIVDSSALSKRFFSAYEQNALAEINDSTQQQLSFFKLWTRKEAAVKTHGRGIASGLQNFSVNYDNNPRFIESSDLIDPDSQWQLHDLDIDANYSAAFCSSKACKIDLRDAMELW